MIRRHVSFALFAFLIFAVFKNWFSNGLITGRDFLPVGDLNGLTLNPYGWGYDINGLGAPSFAYLWITFILSSPLFLFGKIFNLSWPLIQRLAYFYPFLIISIFSSIFLVKKLFPENKFYLLSPFIFVFNTYILMLLGGGQIFIALSYSLFPAVLYLFMKLVDASKEIKNEKLKIKNSLCVGLLFAMQMMLDIRIAYVTMIAIIIYFLIDLIFNHSKIFPKLIFTFFIPLTISILIHSFWILPILVVRQNPINQMGEIYSSALSVPFFSFARFENSLSLLHPNWPENIFGKVYFMRPEFLLLPILAFSSLLFISNKQKAKSKKQVFIIYFSLLALIGAFLAKGANEPFGGVYLWMFNHVPGFQMFRDPTKWYVLVAISYSILIPFTISKTYNLLSLKFKVPSFAKATAGRQSLKLSFDPELKTEGKFKVKNYIQNLFLLLVISYLLLVIRPAIFGQLNGTFKLHQIPNDYIKFNQFISSQGSFYRTFWVPVHQRYVFNSSIHPVISGQNFYGVASVSAVLDKLKSNNAEKTLQESAVKYIVVPFDSEGEIFLEDRKYDEKAYLKTIAEIKKIAWVKEVQIFGKIKVFELTGFKDHFYIKNQKSKIKNQIITYKYINPTQYEVSLKNVREGDLLVFSESFDKNWIAKISNQQYDGLFNSFVLPRDGDFNLTVFYEPQRWVNIGLIISIFSLISVLAFLLASKLKKW